MLYEKELYMESKSFAVGLRIQHPQSMINRALYGEAENPILGPASYKVTHTCDNQRGVYSFCMCPGGYVVNASSEEQMLAVNGMSYQARDSENANSAIIVTVSPDDFPGNDPMAGSGFSVIWSVKPGKQGREKCRYSCLRIIRSIRKAPPLVRSALHLRRLYSYRCTKDSS